MSGTITGDGGHVIYNAGIFDQSHLPRQGALVRVRAEAVA